jgi:amylosucrase
MKELRSIIPETTADNSSRDHLVILQTLFDQLYSDHPYASECFDSLKMVLQRAADQRSVELQNKDQKKAAFQGWFLFNDLCGMSLYVDRFANDFKWFTIEIGLPPGFRVLTCCT